MDQKDVKLSKTLSWILRHGAPKVGLELGPEGFVPLSALLNLPHMSGISIEDVKRVVEKNEKQRYTLREIPGLPTGSSGLFEIRANQGHSLKVPELELTPILDPEQFPVVLHGTFWRHWTSIKAQGLSKMTRQHIHFAPGEPGDHVEGGGTRVISGMRPNCDLLIFIDLEKALRDGFEFFYSTNGVILCPGNSDGILPPEYFSKVVRRNLKTGQRENIDLN